MKKPTALTLLLSASLLLAACQNNSGSSPNSSDNTASQTQSNSTAETSSSTNTSSDSSTSEENQSSDKNTENKGIQEKTFKISLEDAVKKFQDKYGEMMIYAVELTTEKGVYQYEIKGYKDNTEYKVHVHADNGDILSEKEKDDDGNHQEIDFDQLVSPKEAMEKALKEIGTGAYATSWELGEEDGDMSYEVEYDFEDEKKENGDITINAYSGEILKK